MFISIKVANLLFFGTGYFMAKRTTSFPYRLRSRWLMHCIRLELRMYALLESRMRDTIAGLWLMGMWRFIGGCLAIGESGRRCDVEMVSDL